MVLARKKNKEEKEKERGGISGLVSDIAKLPDSRITEQTKTVEECATKAPEKIRPYIVKYAEFIAILAILAEVRIIPFVVNVFKQLRAFYQKQSNPRWKQLFSSFSPIIFGLVLCFFGGEFPLLIAAYEAFILTGYRPMKFALGDLWEEGCKAYECYLKDKEENPLMKDGEMNWAAIQLQFFRTLRAVDPKKVSTAFAAFNAGLWAILAAVRVSFARTIALGAAFAKELEKPVQIYLKPFIKKYSGPEYHDWIDVIIDVILKVIIVSIAFTVQGIISCFHSAAKGGLMCSRAMLKYANEKGWLSLDEEETLLDEFAGYGLAALGIFCQFYNYNIPFPINLFMCFIYLGEWVLRMIVMWG